MKLKIIDERIREHIPTYATVGSAAFDLRAAIQSPVTLWPNETKLIPAGFSLYIEDPKLAGLILPRSGLGHKRRIILGNSTGLIDSDYQGEIQVSLFNYSDDPFLILPLDRIAQMVIIPCIQVKFEIVDSFIQTDRGEGGLGSTGKN